MGLSPLRIGKAKLLHYCVTDLRKDGWEVYKRGFPSLVAVKNCELRMIVINPLVTYGPVILGGGKDAMSEAFYRCWGVKYEIFENPGGEPRPKKWI